MDSTEPNGIDKILNDWRQKLEAMEFSEIVSEYTHKFWESPLPVIPPGKANLIERFLRRLRAEMERFERGEEHPP